MQLDQLALHLRRRGAWEAIDLGCAMARTWWRPLLAAWLTLYVPVALLLHGVFYAQPFIAFGVLWWLKPAFDRVLLEVLSRAVFGDVPSAVEAVRALPRAHGLLGSLTVHRFDLARSFTMPIRHLEKLGGRAARERLRSLERNTRSYGVWLTIVCLHFEFVLIIAFFGAIDLFTPAQIESTIGLKSYFWNDAPLWRQWLDSAAHIIAVTMIEPLYVAGGFALYLNRRTELEAWDVELALRRFARRTPQRAGALAAAVMIGVLLAAALPRTVDAAESRAPEAAIREILAAPEFERYREVTRLRYIGRSDDAAEAPAKPAPTGNVFAELARVLMWLGAIVLIAAAVYLARRYAGVWTPERSVRAPPPDVLFGLDITPGSLPADVASAALAAAQAGDARAALGLLYRGALSALVNGEGVEFAPGDTEGDCIRRAAAGVDPRKAEFFRTLVTTWQATAYGRHTASADVLRALCQDWRIHFGPRDVT